MAWKNSSHGEIDIFYIFPELKDVCVMLASQPEVQIF